MEANTSSVQSAFNLKIIAMLLTKNGQRRIRVNAMRRFICPGMAWTEILSLGDCGQLAMEIHAGIQVSWFASGRRDGAMMRWYSSGLLTSVGSKSRVSIVDSGNQNKVDSYDGLSSCSRKSTQ